MNVLQLYLNDSIKHFIQEILRDEGYTLTATPQAAEALRTIESDDGHYIVIADNFTPNGEAFEAFQLLHNRPEVRQRTRTIGITAMAGQEPTEWVSAGAIDEFMRMPFTPEQLLERIEANAALLAER